MAVSGIELNLPDLPEVPLRLGPMSDGGGGPTPRARSWFDRLRERALNSLPLLLMAVLALFTGWLVKHAGVQAPAPVKPVQHSGPDFTMRGFEVRRYASDGQLKTVLRGQQLSHFGGQRRLEIAGLTLQMSDEQGQRVWAQAQAATALEDLAEVELTGGAHLRASTEDARELDIDSQTLRLTQSPRRISTDLPVRVRWGAQEVRSAGMSFDAKQGVLTLDGPVRAQWGAAAAKAP